MHTGGNIFLMCYEGDIVVQVRLASRIEQAFTAHTALPIQTWIRLDCYVQYAQVLHLTHHSGTFFPINRVSLNLNSISSHSESH